jgi:hypothetical protein
LPDPDRVRRVLARRLAPESSRACVRLPSAQLHVTSSLIASVVCAFVTAPPDMIKTRVMGDTAGRYAGPFDAVVSTVRHEGMLTLWRGTFPSWLRLGPHFLITFPLYERIRASFGLGYL